MIAEKVINSGINTSGLTVDKRSGLSKKEYIKEYVEPGKPVILTDAATNWPAMGKITPEFMKENYGDLVKEINGKKYTVSEYVDLMYSSTPENPAPYPCDLHLPDYFPELLSDFSPTILFAKSDRIANPLMPKFMLKGTKVYEVFLGGNGSSFPFLHIDALYLHAQITQVYGAKDFIFYTNDQVEYLYPRADNTKISSVNVFDPDYEKYPLFRKAKAITVRVEEGETLMIPNGWWHVTQIHEPCITLGRAQLNAMNWNKFINDNYKLWKEYHPKLALPLLIYAKALGVLMSLQEKLK